MVEFPAALLVAFPPSADLLFDRARRQTDNAMLTEIARADYGQMADEMMAELRPIRDRGVVPVPMPWMLEEVLSLTRYSNPDAPNPPPFEPGPSGRRGHQTRLFACALLLRAEAELPPEEGGNTPDSTLAQCLVSASVLGEELSVAAACFLTWRISQRERGFESLLFALGLLVLATRLRSGRLSEPILGTIAEWVLTQESLEQAEFPPNPANPRPLPFSIQSGFWRPLAAELKNEAEAIRDNDTRTNLQLCGLLLDPGLGW
jgi:hypothetical protein